MHTRSTLLSVLLAVVPAVALAQGDTVIEVTGEAAVVAGNALGAKDKAIADALRKAVEQACGTLVVAASRTEKSQLVEDRILTQAKGYVSKYEVLSSSEAKGVASVKVRATVGTSKLADDLAAIGLTLARKGMPRVAVLIVEQRIDETVPALPFGPKDPAPGAKGLVVSQRIVESSLIGDWLKKGFTFVDPELVATGARNAGALNVQVTADQARALAGRLAGQADVLIWGTATAKKSADLKDLLDDGPGNKKAVGVACAATLDLRILTCDATADLLAAGEKTVPTKNVDPLTCGRDSMVAATRALGDELQANLLAKWNAQLANGTRVRIVVKNVDSVKTHKLLAKAFEQQLQGATVSGSPRYADGTSDFDVFLKGSVDDAAETIESWKVAGKKIRVKGMTASGIDAEIAK